MDTDTDRGTFCRWPCSVASTYGPAVFALTSLSALVAVVMRKQEAAPIAMAATSGVSQLEVSSSLCHFTGRPVWLNKVLVLLHCR